VTNRETSCYISSKRCIS